MVVVEVNGQLYDVTRYMKFHPGGKLVFDMHDGDDITDILVSKHIHKHSHNAFNLLGSNAVPKSSAAPTFSTYHEDPNIPIQDRLRNMHMDYNTWTYLPILNEPQYRIFKSAVLEFFTLSPWYLVLIWLPVALFCAVLGFVKSHDLLSVLTLSIVGFLCWVPFEYYVHKYVFHLRSNNRYLQIVQFIIHGNHHKNPLSEKRLVFPVIPAGVILFCIYSILRLLVNAGQCLSFLSGFIVSYVLYDLTHYAVHFVPEKWFKKRRTTLIGHRITNFMKRIRQNHFKHHFDDHTKHFGISPQLNLLLWQISLFY
ncbi:hypothetical protein P9112_009181 [Eukaryota sp. TZLM1-RC]